MSPALQAIVSGYTWTAVKNGESLAEVFELRAEGRPRLFVKTAEHGLLDDLADEASRLAWLSTMGLICPRVLAHVVDQNRSWLVTTALAGLDLESTTDLQPSVVVGIAANALGQLHRIDRTTCPFEQTALQSLEGARMRMVAGLVDEDDFDETRLGRSTAELFDLLEATLPEEEDLVVTHGDASLPNLMAERGEFTGFIDLGRLGVADRHRDLALMARDIGAQLGTEWVEVFFRRYGQSGDPAKLRFYELLDEFF